MSISDVLEWLENTVVATAISESTWLFPTIETIHVLALALVIGSIIMVDLRLLGVANRSRPVSRILAEMLPWTWTSFAVAAASGSLLFMSAAVRYSENVFFLLKMATLMLAGLNMTMFHLRTYRTITLWDQGPPVAGARIAGALSLMFWCSVVAFGRWIGFSE